MMKNIHQFIFYQFSHVLGVEKEDAQSTYPEFFPGKIEDDPSEDFQAGYSKHPFSLLAVNP